MRDTASKTASQAGPSRSWFCGPHSNGSCCRLAAHVCTSKQPGLDDRHRDDDGEIRRKNGNTQIASLRDTYGEHFAGGYRSDMKLKNLLYREQAILLSYYLKKIAAANMMTTGFDATPEPALTLTIVTQE